ncbi:hypothetical protein GQ464_009625 [Rhodocaloribacter litoris]|uniref:hypothetical protein n=1 Tax=Rhodocaloribacter litoris TaxID=2558931 RepID=UPI001E4E999C|nr:hypothetical protein [Rhodocaloribacter litoris]QXD13734.1 hypothetical protein GQ464_009625 [Rhodocaloribacter litoris]
MAVRPIVYALVLMILGVAAPGCGTTVPTAWHLDVPLPKDPAVLVAWRDGLVLGGGAEVRWLRDGRPPVVRRLPAPVRAAAVDAGGALWLGTARGLYRLTTPEAPLDTLHLPALDPQPAVTALAVSPGDALWVGTERFGVFTRRDTTWRPALAAAPVHALAVMPDGAAWVGTGIGLFRRMGRGWLVYSEEGTANHGLPDNIVERLVATPSGLWVVMSEAVAFFPAGDEDHPAEFTYLGRRGNRIHDVEALPGGGFILATDDGLVHLREMPHAGAHGNNLRELQVAEAEVARRLPPEHAGLPPLPHPVTRLLRDGGHVWLARRDGVFPLPAPVPAAIAAYVP